MNRDDFIKFIPKPENKDIILYDISLKNLVDINVLEEYNKLYPVFVNKKNRYNELKQKTEEYQKIIDNIYLFKPSWTEEDYLQNLQNAKKTYSTIYGKIKKIKNNISMLQRNLKGINEKIQIQIAKENKKINNDKENIDKDIDNNRDKLFNLKNYLDTYKLSLNEINEQILDNSEGFKLLASMQSKLEEGKCKCEYCGRTIKSVDEDSLFYKRLYNNIEKNKNQLERLLKQKEKINSNISYYESEIQKIKDNLNNCIQFKKESNNLYAKKNIEVLKLEALRDKTINDISSLQKQLENDSDVKSKQYLDLKSNIEKYELSLENLNKIKEIKKQSILEIEEFNNLKKELKDMLDKINQYLKFIDIYFKILEQKANEYCGNEFKFKFHKIEDYKLTQILYINYQDRPYETLDYKTRTEVDKILAEKFSVYF